MDLKSVTLNETQLPQDARSYIQFKRTASFQPNAVKKTSDVFTKAKRSEVMSRIRSRGNRDTELALAKLLRAHGITGWRRHQPVFGKPDFIFKRARLALFVDGCFWHGCPKHATKPKNNQAFWQHKLSANQKRDKLVNRTLRKAGWRVLRIWECALTRRRSKQTVNRILHALCV